MTSSDDFTARPSDASASHVAYANQNPADAPVSVRQDAAIATGPLLSAPAKRGVGLTVAGIIAISLLSILALLLAVYLLAGLGPVAFGIGGIMALVPLAIVLAGVHWIDRWEPEPRLILVFAFLWGAVAAVIIALLVGAEVENAVASLGGPPEAYQFFGAAIQAPVVEEFGKGFGLLLIFWFARKHFDGPVDGLVYAAWIAGGFAFTENILYFGAELLNSSGTPGNVPLLFLIRGIMSPFAHVMFTACTGILLGIAARRSSAIGVVGWFLVGIIPAMLLHALWNGALFFVDNFFVYYALVQFPLFVGAIVLVVFLRNKEAKLTHDRLSEYAAVGWFNPDEINSLATGAGRRQAMAWARSRGVGGAMRKYTRDSTRLAFTRQRLITGRASIGAEADEAALLASIVATRAALHASSAPQAHYPAPRLNTGV
jgi:protease PrsW